MSPAPLLPLLRSQLEVTGLSNPQSLLYSHLGETCRVLLLLSRWKE